MRKAGKMMLIFGMAVVLGVVLSVTTPLFPYSNNTQDCSKVHNCSEGKCPSPKICISMGGSCQCEYTPPPWPPAG